MILDGSIRQLESARIELIQVASSTEAWSDKQRQAFDSQRMKPLGEAGARLMTALQKAQEQCVAAERLLNSE